MESMTRDSSGGGAESRSRVEGSFDYPAGESGGAERIGEAFEADVKLTVVGKRLEPGNAAPDFSLNILNPGDAFPHEVTLADGAGRVRLLHVVNSLDTPVCHIGAHRFERMAAELPSNVDVYTVSMDLPFAQLRWRSTEGVSHGALSGHRSEAFGRDYGVLLREWRLFERSVFVIDGRGRLKHVEYVPDQMAEPDYDAALAAARAAASSASS
jgi:thiol peroxidase